MSRFAWIEISPAIAEKPDALPGSNRRVRQKALDRAINAVLDDAGAPGRLEVDAETKRRSFMPKPSPTRYLVVLGRDNQVRGHVGPLQDETAAKRVEKSWRSGGYRVQITTIPIGPCLTNAAGGPW